MVRRRRPPSRGWKTFLRNPAVGIASLDLLVVRTISFELLYGRGSPDADGLRLRISSYVNNS